MSIITDNKPARFIDLITFASILVRRSVPLMNCLVHIEGKTDYPDNGRPHEVANGVSCYLARIYYASFDKSCLRFNDGRDITKMIARIDDAHYVFGTIYLFLRDRDYLKFRDNYLIEVKGRLSSVNRSKCVFMMTHWSPPDSRGVFTNLGVYATTDYTFIRDADLPFIQKTIASKELVYPRDPHTTKPPLQEVGVEIENPREIVYEPAREYKQSDAPMGDLGVSQAQKIVDRNIAATEEVVKQTIVPVVNNNSSVDSGNRAIDLNRGKFREVCNEIMEKYNDLDARKEAINNYIISVIPESTEDWCEYYIDLLGNTLRNNWFTKPDGNNGFDGRSLFRYVLEDLLIEDDFKPIWDMFSHTTELVDNWRCDNLSGALAELEPLRNKILYRLFEKLLGLSCDLYVVNLKCMELNRTVFDFIKYAPYRLGLVANISLKDMDKLAVLWGHFYSASSNQDRSVAYYHDYLTDANKMNGSTVMYEYKARLLKPGYYITGEEYMRIINYSVSVENGIYFDNNTVANIKAYFKCLESSMYVNKKAWLAYGSQGRTYYSLTASADSLNTYLSEGIGVKIKLDSTTFIADFYIYMKEVAIYHKLYSFESYLPEIDVDEYIKKFELSQGQNFKLEQRQKEAIKNCFIPENSVYTTTGGAGSGKTTLISGILYVYMMGYGYDKEDIIMVAPTGKAATQITEKTGFEAKTIHSQFKIGLPYDIDEFNAKVVVIDECSMINLDLMYQLLNRIPENCRIIMSGDINQLEPIGFGQPFADSLNFTPIVTLNVMKRAEAGSAINRNAKRMVEGYEKLDQGEDFMIISEGDYKSELRRQIDGLLKAGNTLRDIQVISPVSTEYYGWGTTKINEYLQSLYNTASARNTLRVKKFGRYTLFKVNDPVIHMENDYEMQHYVWDGDVLSAEDKGIRNGEIGVIKKIWIGEDLSEAVTDKESELYMACRRTNAILVEVVYTTAGSTYSIFYNCRNVMYDGNIGPEGWEVQGGNLSSIQLAYAITVHKMQGSQAKHIIILWYKMQNKDFLSRNMLYTACTRAQKTVRLLCEPVVVEQARRIISSDKRISYLKEYFKESGVN